MKLRALGMLCLCLLPCTGCSAKVERVPVPVTERVLPPASLTRETAVPEWNGVTNGDLSEFAKQLEGAVNRCNADKAELRAWAEDTATGQGK